MSYFAQAIHLEFFKFKCLVYEQVKMEHQKLVRLHQSIEISKGKWQKITMDYRTRLPKTLKGFNVI